MVLFHPTQLELDLTSFESIQANVEGMAATFLVFEEFSQGLQQFADEDWLSFRGRTHLFGDFLDSWAARLRSMPPNSVSLRIRSDMEHYQQALPLLKYLRGDVFSAEHWVEFFRMIGFDPQVVTVDKLTFGQLVAAAGAIVANESSIRNLHARAQGEVSVRCTKAKHCKGFGVRINTRSNDTLSP